MMQMVSGMVQSYLATKTDEEILAFIGEEVLNKMTPAQQEKLRDYINQKVPTRRYPRMVS